MKLPLKQFTKLSVILSAFITFGAQAEQPASSSGEASDAKASDFNLTAAIKLHPSVIFGTTITPVSTTSGVVGVADEVKSGTEITPILLLNAKYKDFFVSVGHFFGTSYDIKLQDTNQNENWKRSETDFNVGYYVLPGLGISVGYKEVRNLASNSGNSKFRGPTIGVSGYGAMSDNVGIYGSFGYGKIKFNDPDGSFPTLRRNSYYVAETGLAYTFDIGKALKSLSLTLGYRYQTVQSDNSATTAQVALIGGVATVVGTRTSSFSLSSRGPVLGIVASF